MKRFHARTGFERNFGSVIFIPLDKEIIAVFRLFRSRWLVSAHWFTRTEQSCRSAPFSGPTKIPLQGLTGDVSGRFCQSAYPYQFTPNGNSKPLLIGAILEIYLGHDRTKIKRSVRF